MSYAGLSWQERTLRFLGGLNQKADPRALESPELAICKDGQFDELGGIQTRYPFGAAQSDIFGGGTIADARRIERNGDELLLFTKDSLYSWSSQHSAWVRKATHLAVTTSEQSRFVNTAEQFDCDRAELNGTVVLTWAQTAGSTSQGYVAALDKETGAVLMQPTALAGSAARLRVTALSSKILLTFYDGIGGLYAYALDPASPAAALAGASTTLTNTNYGERYDIVRIASTDQAVFACRRNPTTSYLVGTVTAGLVVATSTKARTCDGPIAVSADPTGAQAQVVRGNGANIQGDLITISTLADVYTAQAIGTAAATPVNQIACAHRSVQDSSQYRCYVFWSYAESADTSTTFGTKYNWVDTGNTLGSQGDLVDHTGVVSRAFSHDGSVYVWIGFAAASVTTEAGGATPQIIGVLQNTYFLYRDDALLVAKAAAGVAGGYASSTGALPSVQTTGTNAYAWAGVERRAIALGGNLSGYGARAPRDIGIEFDSNAARRCARLGKTLYIAGGEILQYDGAGLYEVGFHIYPWFLDLTDFAAGSLGAGGYGYKMTWRWDNAQGERERSTTATSGLVTVAASRSVSIVPWHALNVTHKTDQPPAAELWRTAVNPTNESPFYLVTANDPTQTTGDNAYLPNDHTSMALSAILDDYDDATATTLETNPENGAELENLAPPAASIIKATDSRLFLAGVAGDPDRVWYSKQRRDGEVAAFHDGLAVSIPAAGGRITGLALLFGRLPIVFREKAVYRLDGDGFDNTGGGANYAVERIPGDVGAVNQESIAVTERGIVFQSSKGWHITNGQSIDYIGGPISDYDDEDVLAVSVMEKQHQVRILTASRMLVWDTHATEAMGRPMWSEWTIAGGVHATIWDGVHVYLTSTGPKTQLATYTGVDYGIDVELAWLKLNDLAGYGMVDHFLPLGEFRSACTVRVRCARDYWKDGDGVYFQDKTHTPTQSAGQPLQFRHSPSRKQVAALKVRLTVTPTSGGEGVRLTGLTFRLGFIPGTYRNLSSSQTQ